LKSDIEKAVPVHFVAAFSIWKMVRLTLFCHWRLLVKRSDAEILIFVFVDYEMIANRLIRNASVYTLSRLFSVDRPENIADIQIFQCLWFEPHTNTKK